MLLLDTTHTSHTHAQTGIQRVVRCLFGELPLIQPTIGVCYDPYLRAWRPLDTGELARLRPGQPASASRGAKWPLRRRLVSHAQRLTGAKPRLPPATALVCPELFSSRVGAHWPELFVQVRGPRVALFCDAIPLQFPELSPPGTVARFPSYLRELLQFDGIAAISEASAATLRDYWQWLGVAQPPPVAAIPLAVDSPVRAPARPDHGANAGPARLLFVSTIEGRKNHLALLDACANLWDQGRKFELHLVGLPRSDTAAPALARIAALQQAGRPLHYRGAVADEELHDAYRACTFTVYPSLAEGFGLPVLESLRHGKPCICSAHGALGESARDGGCLTLDSVDSCSLAGAIRRLLDDPRQLAALAAAAHARTFKSWARYAVELADWIATVPVR